MTYHEFSNDTPTKMLLNNDIKCSFNELVTYLTITITIPCSSTSFKLAIRCKVISNSSIRNTGIRRIWILSKSFGINGREDTKILRRNNMKSFDSIGHAEAWRGAICIFWIYLKACTFCNKYSVHLVFQSRSSSRACL